MFQLFSIFVVSNSTHPYIDIYGHVCLKLDFTIKTIDKLCSKEIVLTCNW